jgi:hypothetical protein
MSPNAKKTNRVLLPKPEERRAAFRSSLPASVTTDEQALEVARLLDNEAITETLENELAKHRAGKPKGAVKPSTAYIRTLVLDPQHAGLKDKQLYAIARKSGKIGAMEFGTFRNHVTAARKEQS